MLLNSRVGYGPREGRRMREMVLDYQRIRPNEGRSCGAAGVWKCAVAAGSCRAQEEAWMSGTDKTKASLDLAGPVVILVEPQLGENIGMTARAMGNFALSRLRIVNPRDGWPNVHARRAASGADHILDGVELFDTVEAAVADCTLLFAP